jgi:hypothetical protein
MSTMKSKKSIFEPIIGCKHPIIASRVTPIGSAGRTPDEKLIIQIALQD